MSDASEPWRDGRLTWGDVDVEALAAQFGTPLFVYDAGAIRRQLARLRAAFSPWLDQLHYSVKANSNLSVLRLLRDEGVGFDAVSGGEVARCLAVDVDPRRIVFAGVGKTREELADAVSAGVGCFNVESVWEWERLVELSSASGPISVALRVNPDVDARTHRYITTGREHNKFGIDEETAFDLLRRWPSSGLEFAGFHLHIGSQITDAAPWGAVADAAARLVDRARSAGHAPSVLNLGGGFGVGYGGRGLDLQEAARAMASGLDRCAVPLWLEPGRFLVAEAGVLVGRVLHVKRGATRRFVVGDAAMNDLMRPALYEAHHPLAWVRQEEGEPVVLDLVGPICESADVLASERTLREPREGDLFALFGAGAYGFVMSSNYNSRPRAAEVLVDGGRATLVRRRETVEELFQAERLW